MGAQTLDREKIHRLDIRDFSGGWNPRMSPLLLSDGEESPMETPDARNCDFSYPGAVSKRFGKTQQGGNVVGATAWQVQGSQTGIQSIGIGGVAGNQVSFAQKITADPTALIDYLQVNLSVSNCSSLYCYFYTNNSGVPGTLVLNGTSSLGAISSKQGTLLFYFPSPPSLTNGTVYWLVIVATYNGSSTGNLSLNCGVNAGSAAHVLQSVDGALAVYTAVAGISDIFYSITSLASTSYVQGLYDMRTGTGTITQNIMAAVGGALYYKAGSTWTSIASGLGSGQNVLWDFTESANYLYSCDYANNYNQVWDGSATATMPHGYRLSPGYVASGTPTAATIASYAGTALTMSASQPASGLYVGKVVWLTGGATAFPEQVVIQSFTTSGTAGTSTYYVTAITTTAAPIQADRTTIKWNGVTVKTTATTGITTAGALTTFKIIGITELLSGGYRCSDEISVDLPAGTATAINLTNIAMNSSTNGTQFAFDVPSGATVWYMTAAFNPTLQVTDPNGAAAQLYYRLPTTAVSTSLNPMTNATTAFNITAIPATTQNTPVIDTGFDQGFFTSQIDAPRAKYFETWNDMIVTAGDPNGSCNLWLTPVGMPNVYSTEGGVNGAMIPVPNFNDGEIIRGIYVWQGSLYIFKNQSVYRLIFTGQTGTSPFYLVKLMGEIGCLSHWSITESDQGIIFLSVQGPALCYGSIVTLLPCSKDIMNMFQVTDTGSFNLASMIYTTGLLYQAKKQIWWSVSSNTATTRDTVLIYDYEKQIFWLNNSVSANYFATIHDSNGFPQPWSGDYSANIWRHDLGADDGGSTISWYWSTPHLPLGDPFSQKQACNLYVSGIQQTSGTLYVDVYVDFSSTVTQTYTFDMSVAAFQLGGIQQAIRMNLQGQYFRFVMRNSDLDVPVQVQAMSIEYQNLGRQT